MTIQTLFNRMMLEDNQLDLIAGGDDVTRGLTALNLAQDWFEIAAAEVTDFLQTYSTFTTTTDQEYTTWPTGLLRMDDPMYLLDSGGRQLRELELIDKVGGHQPGLGWPVNELLLNIGLTPGIPSQFYAKGQGGRILWTPTPNAVYTIRAYGLWAAADYTAAADTFLYPDSVALPLVPHAAVLFRRGLDRDIQAQQSAAVAAFRLVIRGMGQQVRNGAKSRAYSDSHDT